MTYILRMNYEYYRRNLFNYHWFCYQQTTDGNGNPLVIFTDDTITNRPSLS